MSSAVAIAIAVVTSALSAAAVIVAAMLTRRSSRESNAVTGYASLTGALQTEVSALRAEVAGWRRGARKHREWDDLARAALRRLGEDIPPPPPIDPLEADA